MSIRTVELEQSPDADGIARLQVPVGVTAQRFRFTIQVEPVEEGGARRQWSEGFFDRTYGQWQGELERAPQGEFEQREEF